MWVLRSVGARLPYNRPRGWPRLQDEEGVRSPAGRLRTLQVAGTKSVSPRVRRALRQLQLEQGKAWSVRSHGDRTWCNQIGGAGGGFSLLTGGRRPNGGPRECKRCGEMFQRTWGNQRYCEACKESKRHEYMRSYNRLYYSRNASKIKADSKRWGIENPERARRLKLKYANKMSRFVRREVIGHYSKGTFGCTCCGESEFDFLAIDHVAGDANRTSKEQGLPRAGTPLYMWLFRNGFPRGYQTLCANCNLSKQKHGDCVHKLPALNLR